MLMAVLKRRGFLQPSYGIYGGVAGFYEYGPLGTRLKRNVEDLWRDLYVLEEEMLEVETPTVSPEAVFKASGHVDRFADPLVECEECSASHRADHLLEDAGHEDTESLDLDGVEAALTKLEVRCPACGGPLGEPYHFNLMFPTTIGPGKGRQGYLRPETAQGIFMAFPWIYRQNREKLPVGGVQIGNAYRNEISPRQGVIRMREFHQMEAEVFFDPQEKSWPRWPEVKETPLRLLPRDRDEEVTMTAAEAVDEGIVGNEAVGYFLVRTQEFLDACGLTGDVVRFRQHHGNEMAHYSEDTWDAEYESPRYGWVEIVGVADRTDYDLRSHEEVSGQELRARRRFDEAREVEVHRVVPDPAKLGPVFRGQAKDVMAALEALDPTTVTEGEAVTVTVDGEEVEVPPEGFTVEHTTETVTGESFVPHVVEPSYGADRILFAILETHFEPSGSEAGGARDWSVLRLPPHLAPYPVAVFPLLTKDGLPDEAQAIHGELREAGLLANYDDGGNIGRRYARMDEVGTPFCITVDHETLEEGTVTIRDRDTTEQVRVDREELVDVVEELLAGDRSVRDLA